MRSTTPPYRRHYGKGALIFAGASGLVTTILGMALALFPARLIAWLLSYEIWSFGGILLFIGLAGIFLSATTAAVERGAN